MLYEKGSKCRCSAAEIRRYLSKISGPFLERIDLFSEMRMVSGDDMASIYIDDSKGKSQDYRITVERCWQIAHERYGENNLDGTFPEGDLRDSMRIPEKVIRFASDLSEKGFFSARGFTRILRVARTIADINEAVDVSEGDVAEAIQYRLRGY